MAACGQEGQAGTLVPLTQAAPSPKAETSRTALPCSHSPRDTSGWLPQAEESQRPDSLRTGSKCPTLNKKLPEKEGVKKKVAIYQVPTTCFISTTPLLTKL